MMRASRTGAIAATIASAAIACGATTRVSPAPLDPDRWAARNVEAIAEAARAAGDDDKPGSPLDVAVGFSFLAGTALLDSDARLDEVAAALRSVAATRPANRPTTRALAAAERVAAVPRDERMLRMALRTLPIEDGAATRPIVDAERSYEIATGLRNVPGRDYERLATPLIDALDAACRVAGRWDGLGLVYHQVASDALRRGDAARANRYIDRLLALLREHPAFETDGGNTAGIIPSNLGAMMARAGRTEECVALARGFAPALRAQVVAGLVAIALEADRADDARRLIAEELPADESTRLLALLDAREDAAAPSTRPGIPDPFVAPHGSIEASIARHHARRGRIELATRQLAATGGEPVPYPELALLARRAGDGGHVEAARRGFEAALAGYSRQDAAIDSPEGIAETSELVRRFVAIGEYGAAADLLQRFQSPGASTYLRLAIALRKRGDLDAARASLRKAIELGERSHSKEGAAMAGAAVELNELGEPAEAERVLLAAFGKIAGEDFGFGGTDAVVRAARRMNRVDLLDRLYREGRFGERLLLALVASRQAWADANDPGRMEEDLPPRRGER